jgi:hypothetical protein
MKKVNIFLIISKYLDNRTTYINSSLSFIKILFEKFNYTVNINYINDPDSETIKKNIEDYNKRIDYNVDNENNIFKNQLISLNENQLSNLEKHRKALQDVKANELNIIIEDDIIVTKDYIDNIIKAITHIEKNKDNIDFLILSDFNENNKSELEILKFEFSKILVSKCCYMINKKTADILYDYLNQIKYALRISLSKFLYENQDNLDIYIFNKCTFLEGTKIGLFPSSTKNKNFLSQNNNFIELVKITNNQIIDDNMFIEADKLYKSLEYLNNPDILHIYGLLHFKRNNYEKAQYYMNEAVYTLNKNKGYISKTNEILNNSINMNKYTQNIENLVKEKSKYSV